MPVQIDMDMPKSCFVCPLGICFIDSGRCMAAKREFDGSENLTTRPPYCPLREVKKYD